MDEDASKVPPLEDRLQTLGISYKLLVTVLALIDMLGPFATDAHLPSLPDITSDLNTKSSLVELTVLLYTIVMSFATLFGGVLSEKYGRRKTTLLGLLIFIIGNFICAIAPTILVLNIARVIQAIGGGFSTIVTSSVARDVFLANERLAVLGILGSIRPAAIALAPMIGGYIGETFNWRAVFYTTCIVATFVFILTLFKLPETQNKFFGENGQSIKQNQSRNVNNNKNNNKNVKIGINNSSAGGINNNHNNKDNEDINAGLLNAEYSVENTRTKTAIEMNDGNDINDMIDYSATSNEEMIGNNGDNGKNENQKNGVLVFFSMWQIACNDYIFVILSIISIFEFMAIALYLNVFSFIFENWYNFNTFITGILLGIAAIFVIFGSTFSIFLGNKFNITGLNIIRISVTCSLFSSLLMFLLPILRYLLKENVITHSVCHSNNDNFNLFLCFYHICNDAEWYYILFPFCLFTFGAGCALPPLNVIQMEPYPHIAGLMVGISMFWTFVFSYSAVIIITQIVSQNLQNEPFLVHFSTMIIGIILFIIAFVFIRKSMVDKRMTKNNESINNDEH